jgi:hypothetical protein
MKFSHELFSPCKLRFLLEPRALTKIHAEGMLHDPRCGRDRRSRHLPIECPSQGPRLQIAWRLDLRKVEPPVLVARAGSVFPPVHTAAVPSSRPCQSESQLAPRICRNCHSRRPACPLGCMTKSVFSFSQASTDTGDCHSSGRRGDYARLLLGPRCSDGHLIHCLLPAR